MLLDIYLRDPYVSLHVRQEKIAAISFVGNVGGLLGLFLGFSFISAVEVLYVLAFGLEQKESQAVARRMKAWAEKGDVVDKDLATQTSSTK